ncbi:MAG: PKD domain-containing protein [Bacteroidia bacterium]
MDKTLTTSTNGIIHAYASSGTYTPCVITTFSDGCMDTTCSTYNITLGGSGSCLAWFSYGVNGQTVNFQDSSATTSPVVSWWWDFGDGSTDSLLGSALSHSYASPGTYNVTLEIFTQDTCRRRHPRGHRRQWGQCSAGFTHAPDTSGQYTILAYNTSVGNNLSYLWNFGDGSTSTLPYPVHAYTGPGTYNVCLAVTQISPACTDTFCDTVTVTQKQLAAFTFGVWNPATQVTPDPPAAQHALELFPIPASNLLHIRLPEGAFQAVQISNALGQMVMKEPAPPSNEIQLDLSALPDGMYFVRVGETIGRFLIQR